VRVPRRATARRCRSVRSARGSAARLPATRRTSAAPSPSRPARRCAIVRRKIRRSPGRRCGRTRRRRRYRPRPPPP
jgi:hypothetical protein